MDFKIGKTCNDCDQIIKNMKKIADYKPLDASEDLINPKIGKKDIADYLKTTSESSEKVSKELVKSMESNTYKRAKKSRR